MPDIQKGVNEPRFSEMIRARKSIGTGELSRKAEKVLFWKKTASDTVRMRFCDKGIFKTGKGIGTSLISEKEFYAIQSENSVEGTFQGSLPAFLAAFTSRKQLSREEAAQLRRMMDEFEEG